MNAPLRAMTVTLQGAFGEHWLITPGVIDQQAIDAYESSHSLSLACAISDRTDWPVILHLAHADGGGLALIRAWAQVPSGRLVDINGCQPRSVAEGALGARDFLHEVAADDSKKLLSEFADHMPTQDPLLAGIMAQPVIEACLRQAQP